MSNETPFDESSAIAIVGMAGRFPRSADVETFWANIRDGVECLTRFTEEELEEAGVDPALIRQPGYIKVGGPLEGMVEFDAGFFGFSPRDASIMDPQHRHILECAWEALEDAAIDPDRFDGAIGVFAGSGHNAYMPYNLLTNPALVDSVGFFLLRHTGNDKDFLTTRISYCLKLTGPSVNVQTACSTSLVAIHLACQSLLSSECDLALAGGVTIELPHGRGYLYQEGEILSSDGHCRAFDADSKGTLFGSGAGLVALRRYADAVEDGDIIHAVIRGSAINNDGANKVGYLAPSVEGQAACIGEALALSEVEPDTITYVECHGTGTPVGDPIEVAALTQAFRQDTDATQFCGIGSVKTNIGHLDTAAGVASVIKVVKALKDKVLPPSLHFRTPNPRIEFETSPFYVNAERKPWDTGGVPRRAGVNSLGVGGTNAFVVLEEAPERAASGPSRPYQLVTLSARSADAVARAGQRLAAHLENHPELDLADVAYTLATGRRDFAHRRVVVATDRADAAAALAAEDPARVFTQRAGDRRAVAFTFPGGGAQYPNMGRELYERETVYREEVDRCLATLDDLVDWDLRELIFPAPGDEERAAAELQHGSRTLPSLFITEYALAKQFMAWGIAPKALLGHSMGEYVAACLAGVFSPEDGLRMVLKRGQLFETLDPGAMLSVPMPKDELLPLMGDELDIAVINNPSITVASGPVPAIEALHAKLEAREVDSRRIKIHVAAHSSMLDPILPEFAALTKTISFSAPELPFLSNVSGTWITAEEATDPDYWVRHLRSTVQFSANLEELLSDTELALLEVAPGRTLSSLAKAHPSAGLGRPIFNSLRHPSEEVSDLAFLLDVLGRLWMSGVEVDWQALYEGEDRQRVSLPTYPFEHQRYWVEPGKSQAAAAARSLRKKGDVSDWFYQPSWRRQLMPSTPSLAAATAAAAATASAGDEQGKAGPWLVFMDQCGLGQRIAERLRGEGQTVIEVAQGEGFARRGDDDHPAYAVRPDSPEDYDALWSLLEKRALTPRRILHLWTVVGDDAPTGLAGWEAEQARGFYSLLSLAQAMGKAGVSDPIDIAVVTSSMQQVAGEPVTCPERATVLGPARVMMQELPGVVCRVIDVELSKPGTWQHELLLDRIPHEVLTTSADHIIAYRGHDRFVQSFEPVRLPAPAEASSRLRAGGVYLITGGLGGLGLVLARHLAKTHQARLVLVGRTALPAPDERAAYVASHGRDDKISARIREVQALEEAGAEVMVATADVTRLADMTRVVAEARSRFGALHGVFHTAGVLDDGIIQLKTRERAAAVLAPKVLGTLVLDQAVHGVDLDFMVLFSSVSALTGLTGQVDYAAANAFLDAYAHARTERDGRLCVALDWNAWQQVGMAAELARELGLGGGGVADRPAEHPLLDRSLRETARRREYAVSLNTEAHWVVDEHRIKGGAALVPGTGHVELVRAALAESAVPDQEIEIRDLTFMAPFVVPDGEDRELRVVLDRDGQDEAWRARILGPGGTVHVTGEVAYVPAQAPAKQSLEKLRARCRDRVDQYDSAADEHLDFGPRWNNRQTVAYGDGEAVVSLSLPAEFADDCPGYGLHPALLDFATAGAQALIPGFSAAASFYVPLSYGRVRVHAPLTPKVVSHVRLREGAGEVAVYDVTIYDPNGVALCDISEFVMRKVEDRAVMSEVASATTAGSIEARPDSAASGATADDGGAAVGNPILELGLAQGILPEEGMDAIERVLAGPIAAQLVVSSQDLDALIESTRPAEPWESGEGAEDEGGAIKVTRPNLATAFVAPETDIQKTVAKVWEEILGVEGIGVHDDFFDLGGHSLLLTQVVSRVRKQVDAEISLRSLFEKRTVAGIAEEIEKAQASGAPAGPTLVRVDRGQYRDESGALVFPASFMQQRLWFLDQVESGRAVYNIPQCFRLRGRVDKGALQSALSEIVSRHESLRTSFRSRDGRPEQVVHEVDVPIEHVDLTGITGADQRLDEAARRANELGQTAFDLAKGPLMRAALFRLGDDDHVLFLDVHHSVCDGWSLALLFSELSAIYAARVAGEPSPLAPQQIQYGDYAVWQHELFSDSREGSSVASDLAFWKEYLSGDLDPLALPFDHQRPPEPSLRGKLARFHLSPELTDAIRALAREESTSLFMTLLAGFQAFLARISGQSDIRVGSPIANRDREELRAGIGFYTNTVVFRGDLSGGPSFRELLAATRERSLKVLAHQEVPLERVVEAVNPDRRAGDNPLFQVMFAVQQAPESALSLPGVAVSGVDVHSATSKFDLLLEMQELPAGMQCFFEYATDLFEDGTAERLVGHFRHMLAALVAEPDRSVAEAPVLADEDRERILVAWNDTAADYDRDARLHDRVAAQAKARPDAVAVVAGDDQLDYRTLDQRSSKLAHHLQSLGVGPDVMVGVYVERGVDMMVALLAALKAGGAYLPLDPSFPEDRIAYMLADSGAPVILTQAELVDDLPEHQATVFRLDADWDSVAGLPAEAPASDSTTSDHLAYSIYTSGSTGKPKGVEIPHRAVVNFLASMAQTPGFGPDDKLLAVTTLSFDISVLELFLPLTTGGTVIVASRDQAVDGPDLMELLDATKATVMQATPATWRLLIEADWEGSPSLTKVLCGGEAWPPGLARELIARVPEVWNMYGPTETTIWSTCARITDPDDVTIGTPIANTQVYVLDKRLQPVPVGVAGELHIGGDGVARGYHERPELTGERFIQSPFGDGRLYKTGDSVKFRPDGTLEYLDRIDNQVKVRGYRIELGEIEAVLEKHPDVKQPVVIVWDSGNGDKRLAAYVVHEAGKSLTGSELRSFLRGELPDYMIPHLFVELDELPLTANGKINRRALPDPLKQSSTDEHEFIAPRTANEKLVAELWRSILKIDDIGVQDNFFDLGGHSLLSAQVTFRLEKETGYRISPRAMVFQNLAQIAAELPARAETGDSAASAASTAASTAPAATATGNGQAAAASPAAAPAAAPTSSTGAPTAPAAASRPAGTPPSSTSAPRPASRPLPPPEPEKPLTRRLFDKIRKRLR
ncbi:amino acid adenylation domain-containing protein [Haliangium sp.]|uniref:type I polyketide synthase n=1 Tax=Haliangium sp. TaxID=2663208 RepID=UPI003D0ADA2D